MPSLALSDKWSFVINLPMRNQDIQRLQIFGLKALLLPILMSREPRLEGLEDAAGHSGFR